LRSVIATLARNAKLCRIAAAVSLLALGVAGCATLQPRSVLPNKLVSEAEIVGLPGIRMWGDASAEEIDAVIRQYESKLTPVALRRQKPGREWPTNILAISGGGDDGAFGAGLLVGWSAGRGRPQFDLVTGVSAGALIAPLVFLGPQRDADLKDVFTKHARSDILSMKLASGLLGGPALADSTPLARLIDQYVDRQLLQEVARERQKGRVLLIGTTNLDAQRPVLWDMGRIAMSEHPQALSLFRKILLASASVPGLFPPVRLQVQAGGGVYDELHVDGGITQQVFVAPPRLRFGGLNRTAGVDVTRRLYVIRNGKISPEWQAVDEWSLAIARRSISTLTKSQSIGDLYRIYAAAKRDGIDFNLAAIPPNVELSSSEPFDQVYMTSLFELGYRLGQRGYPWLKAPPGMENAGVRVSDGQRPELAQ
jgi:predicted acylesterase/phospholipase RssA